MPKCCVLAGTCWLIRTFNEEGWVSDWFPYTFLTTIDWQKTIKLRDTNYFTPPPLLSLLFLFSLSSNQRFCNVYSQAAHFRSGFSGGEIHDLRRLRREGFPERPPEPSFENTRDSPLSFLMNLLTPEQRNTFNAYSDLFRMDWLPEG